MLYLVLRRPNSRTGPAKERRRPHRLDDQELRVDVTPDAVGGFNAKVTHVPTQLSAAESAPTRELAVRRAHDKLAGILAGLRRRAEKAMGRLK
jgi:hypothetical protein